ncbi:MAG: hypothetical protein IJA52_04995 [Clostridia bacterium]|nr:hypothetical protein [Clostridia bacterium]
MNNTKYPLWNERRDLPSLSFPPFIIIFFCVVGFATLSAVGFGGAGGSALAGVGFAVLLCAKRGVLPWLAPLLSFGISYLITGDVTDSLTSLLFVLFGVVLSYMIFTGRSLTVTVCALTVCTALSMGAGLINSATELYGQGIKESLLSFGREFKALISEVFSAIGYLGKDNELYGYSPDVIEEYTETVIMMLPSVMIMVCQVIAYGAARLFQLISVRLGYASLFKAREMKINLSLGASVIFIASFAAGAIFAEIPVILYAAVNIAYIIMPCAAVAGVRYLFSKDGPFKKGLPRHNLIMIIALGAFAVIISRFSVLPLLAFLGSGAVIWKKIFTFVASRRKDDDNLNN